MQFRTEAWQTCLILAVALCPVLLHATSDRGVIYLDDLTFEKIVDGSKHVLVRFDKEYAWGDTHDEFKEIAKKIGNGAREVLVTSVPVSKRDYEPQNADLAAKYGVEEKDFPIFFLFPKKVTHLDTPMRYEGEVKADRILNWLGTQTGAFFGLKGQVQVMDALARKFLLSSTDNQKATATEAKGLLKSVDAVDKFNAEYYVKTMERVLEKGVSYVLGEQRRISKLLEGTSLTPEKIESFEIRSNILMSFNPGYMPLGDKTSKKVEAGDNDSSNKDEL